MLGVVSFRGLTTSLTQGSRSPVAVPTVCWRVIMHSVKLYHFRLQYIKWFLKVLPAMLMCDSVCIANLPVFIAGVLDVVSNVFFLISVIKQLPSSSIWLIVINGTRESAYPQQPQSSLDAENSRKAAISLVGLWYQTVYKHLHW